VLGPRCTDDECLAEAAAEVGELDGEAVLEHAEELRGGPHCESGRAGKAVRRALVDLDEVDARVSDEEVVEAVAVEVGREQLPAPALGARMRVGDGTGATIVLR